MHNFKNYEFYLRKQLNGLEIFWDNEDNSLTSFVGLRWLLGNICPLRLSSMCQLALIYWNLYLEIFVKYQNNTSTVFARYNCRILIPNEGHFADGLRKQVLAACVSVWALSAFGVNDHPPRGLNRETRVLEWIRFIWIVIDMGLLFGRLLRDGFKKEKKS